MIDSKQKILVSSVRKLLRRGALRNIKSVLDKTHTADIAHLLEELEEDERLAVFKIEIPPQRRAEILSYLSSPVQEALIQKMDAQQVNILVSLMESDDAADLLSNLEEDVSKKILESLPRDEKEDVQDLMSYPPDSAGGMMSSEFLSLSQELSVADAIRSIQGQDEQSVTFYVYITDDEGRLVGVLSLKQLLLSKPNSVLRDIMIRDIISVNTETNQVEVASLVERYDFLSIPVVDAQFRLVGVITVDDVIDVIRAEAQEDLLAMGQVSTGSGDLSVRGHLRSRLPWLGMTFIGGAICTLIVEAFVPAIHREPYWAIVAFLPLLLALTGAAGNQAAAVTVEAIISGRISTKDTVEHLIHEMKIAALIGVGFAFLSYGLALMVSSPPSLAGFVSSVLAVQIFVAMFLGTLIPLSLRKLNLDPTVSTVSIFAMVSNISCVFVLFGIAYRFFYPAELG